VESALRKVVVAWKMGPGARKVVPAARSAWPAPDSGIPRGRVTEHCSSELAGYRGRRDYGKRFAEVNPCTLWKIGVESIRLRSLLSR
jgi:hypothetical protein